MIEDQFFSEITRRIRNLIQLGTVCQVDTEKAKCRLILSPSRVSPWIPWLMLRAGDDYFWSVPDLKEQGLMFCPDGNSNKGVALFGLWSEKKPIKCEKKSNQNEIVLKDGTEIRHCDEKKFEIDFPDGGGIEYDYTKGEMNLFSQGNAKIYARRDVQVSCNGSADVKAGVKAKIKAPLIDLEGGPGGPKTGVITQMCVCALTGATHPMGSLTVRATN